MTAVFCGQLIIFTDASAKLRLPKKLAEVKVLKSQFPIAGLVVDAVIT